MRTRDLIIVGAVTLLAFVARPVPAGAQAAENAPPAEAAAPARPQTAEPTGPRIAPRDQVKILVFNAGVKEEGYSNTYLVDTDGAFEYPNVGRIRAMGLTPRELEADVQTRLAEYLRDPRVSIDVIQAGDRKIILNGEVRVPGEYMFSGDTTLFAMLTKAGSLTDAAGDVAIIQRGSLNPGVPAETIRVDLTEMMSGESMRNNIPLQDGDVVVIPKSEPVYVSGFVQSTGAIYVKRNTTVQQALSMAGGITDRGAKNRITIRRLVNGKYKDIKVEDWATDLVQPGDTITVHGRLF